MRKITLALGLLTLLLILFCGCTAPSTWDRDNRAEREQRLKRAIREDARWRKLNPMGGG